MKLVYIILLIFALIFFPVSKKKDTSGIEDKKKIFTVILDAGHGGKDPGTIGLSGVYEKNIVLPITKKVNKYLSNEYDDINVILTRDTDEFIELKKRGQIANEEGGNLFVSIHCNAKKSEENDKRGFEIYLLDLNRIDEAQNITLEENKIISSYEKTDSIYLNKKKIMASMYEHIFLKYSERISQIADVELIKGSKMESRGVRQAGFWVLLSASMPSILIECGYLSNKEDEEYLKSEKGQDEIAKSIYKAIRYFKMDYDFENSMMNKF